MKPGFLFVSAFTSLLLAACNNAGKKEKEPRGDSTITGETKAPANPPFSKVVTYGNYKFTVKTQGESEQYHFTLIPEGLAISNDTFSVDVSGAITDVLIDDMDGDNSPEIAVIDLQGPEKKGSAYVFSAFNGKSMGMVNFPEVPASDPVLAGYKGQDEFNFVENTFIRRFPIYQGETKTGKMRQLQYKLKPGEAMKQLVLDKSVDF